MKPVALICIPALLMAAAPAQGKASAITYDCDTPSDHFSELLLPVPDGAVTLTGKVQVRKLAQFKQFAPMVRIGFVQSAGNPGEAPSDTDGIKIVAMPAKLVDKSIKDPGVLIQLLQWDEYVSGKEMESKPISVLPVGEALPFSMRLTATSISISFAGSDKSFATAINAPVVRVVCSTGEFLITDLLISPTG
ncbi:hypothetical protein [Novosphingobium taihuense]|nr:hypothetical protein [Novosphingobium taihuense]TWH86153.1 hypothetical protein IQ25_01601 [Novosphingobium taihuense]